jgi:hypothetical protein
MLRRVGYELFNVRHDIMKKCVLVKESAESYTVRATSDGNSHTRYLAGHGTPDFCLGILQQLDESWNQVPAHNFVVYRFRNLQQSDHTLVGRSTNLFKSIGDHVSNAPAFIFE